MTRLSLKHCVIWYAYMNHSVKYIYNENELMDECEPLSHFLKQITLTMRLLYTLNDSEMPEILKLLHFDK